MTEEKVKYEVDPIKASVYLDNQTLKYINSVTPTEMDINRSAEINRAIKDLTFLFRNLIPKDLLKNDEFWSVLLNVYAGSCSFRGFYPIQIASDIMDCYSVIDVEKLGKHERNAAKTAADLSEPVQLAVLHVIQKFWARSYDPADDDSLLETITKLNDGVYYD